MLTTDDWSGQPRLGLDGGVTCGERFCPAAEPDIVTGYHYDYQNPNWLADYGTINSRLIWQQTVQGETTLETEWYDYCRGGHVERIVTEAGASPGEYFVEHFQYNGVQQMWLYRTFTCEADQDKNPINVVGLSAWEFRYAGDRQRYLVRERDPNFPDWEDPNQPPYLEPIDDGRWFEYVGEPNNPVMNVEASYTHAAGVGGALLWPTGGALV